ncbi:MAG: RsmB/NOP family class I SAM-dependent RNA methyltransferase [Anaerolineales bacterium]
MKNQYPTDFQIMIQDLLQEDAPTFWGSYEDDPPFTGLRINTQKDNHDVMLARLPGQFQPLPWIDHGYQIIQSSELGKHIFHAAGLYYLQEPSAMVPVIILDPQPGEKILDLCAAPGGKTTQILSEMKNQGWLLANDPNPKRVQALKRNMERWGSRNSGVTNETPARLAEHFGPIFDRVLIDAPCSGEGTFRSNPGSIKKWSTRFRDRCSLIQEDILWQGAKLVRPGGVLVYSTCTFNQHENEGSIKRFLDKNPEFYLEQIPVLDGFSKGFSFSDNNLHDFSKTIRIWPHQAPGEGHFIALLRRKGNNHEAIIFHSDSGQELEARQRIIYQDFYYSTIKLNSNTEDIHPESLLLKMYGNQLYLVLPGAPPLEGLRVEHWGWWIGTIQNDLFLPSPALATGLIGEDSQKVLEFSIGDQDLDLYQRGSPIKSDLEVDGSGNWILVTVEGYPLGWGKIIKGKIKSYLPTWLRTY